MQTMVVLDIGAGSKYFARRLRAFNPLLSMYILCGEPTWQGVWKNDEKVTGQIKKIRAAYKHFNVPDSSLDLVTLNAFHPLMPPHGIHAELKRTLRPGGIFINAHPVGYSLAPDEDAFIRVQNEGCDFFTFSKVKRYRGFFLTPYCHIKLSEGTLIYPASWTIRERITELSFAADQRCGSSSYVYSNTISPPKVEVWVRR